MTDLPSVLLTLQGNLSKPLSPQVKSEKTRSSAGRCVIKTIRTVGLWRNKASQTGAERSVFSFVRGLFKQPLPPFCDWSKPLLYVAKCLCCCTQLGRCHGFWKSPADFRICFSLRTSQLFIGLVWRRRSVFWNCLNFVPLTTIKSVTFGGNCVKKWVVFDVVRTLKITFYIPDVCFVRNLILLW